MCEMEEYLQGFLAHTTPVSSIQEAVALGRCSWKTCLNYNKEGSAELLLLIHPEQKSSLTPYCKSIPGQV